MADKLDLTNSFTFSVDVTVPSGENFAGTFTMHRPNIEEKRMIGIRTAQGMGGMTNVDVVTANISYMTAVFDTLVDKSPVWWKPRELYDMEVLQAVYDNFENQLQRFQGKSESKEISQGATG